MGDRANLPFRFQRSRNKPDIDSGGRGSRRMPPCFLPRWLCVATPFLQSIVGVSCIYRGFAKIYMKAFMTQWPKSDLSPEHMQ